ncbi:hypothetical protein HAX54_001655 [Datura stramonium]|uniref:Acid phosphatase n=1 Tax=Datura stramonium TaxID=4076 RepID=A0ABS8T4T6_DATST|nr:hypothetical protein [Datura stramonium]
MSMKRVANFCIDNTVKDTALIANSSIRGFVMVSNVESEGKISAPMVQVRLQHVTCMEDAALFITLSAAIDLIIDAYLEAVSYNSLQYAKSLEIAAIGKDVWVFDIDETLLSMAPFFAAKGWGSEPYEKATWIEWQEEGPQPALPASLNLYKELQQLGFNLILITGHLNLAPSEVDTPATIYKSQKRKELEDEGYKIWGSSGDQWSDLMGFSQAKRSFKLPNLMYYIA